MLSSQFFVKCFSVCLILCLVSSVAAATTYYVDDDGPYDPNVSDPLMDGSAAHPFDNVQGGINAADPNDSVIIVMQGTYYENINFNGKNIVLTSIDPEDPNVVSATIIDGGGKNTVVIFQGTETSACVLSGFTIRNGFAKYGGGIYGARTQATISHCTIIDNTASNIPYESYGGGLVECDGLITHCTIMDNRAYYYGGGLVGCDGAITNCTIKGNTANNGGGLYNCDGLIVNCTIIGNSAGNDGGGMNRCNGSITNCIVWGNSADWADQLGYCSAPNYSCAEDWWALRDGTGNITSDPQLADISSSDSDLWDLHLLSGSPCIDAGTNTPPGGLPTTDIEGNPRPFDGDYSVTSIADMGAYEYYVIPSEAYLSVVSKSFSFTTLEAGANPNDQTFIVFNPGQGTLDWIIDTTDKPDWLSLTPASGSLAYGQHLPVTISVDTSDMSGGLYSYSFEVTAPGALHSPQTVTVELELIGPELVISTNSLTFYTHESNSDSQNLTISNPGGGLLNWSIDTSGKPDWLTITPTGGNLSHEQSMPVSVSMNTTGLPDGVFTHSFEVADSAAQNSPQEIMITLYNHTGDIHVPRDYSTIQEAIEASCSGNTIVVSPGTYYEDIHFSGKDIILTSTDPTDPNSTVIYGGGVRFSGTETLACRLNGFTITRGSCVRGYGTKAMIENCTITRNSNSNSYWIGGGVYDCDGAITNCTITDNTAYWVDGDYYCHGGGLAGCDGSITNCTIMGNKAEGEGGGLYDCNGTIANCTIMGNAAWTGGGGLFGCDGSITNCTIMGNKAKGEGGGLHDCDGAITNCMIADNTADSYCGGLSRCNGPITNCTIANNWGGGSTVGGGLYACVGRITNCIIWGNRGRVYHSSVPTYSCIQDGTGGGTGNIASDPLFADPDNGDYHVKSEYGRWCPGGGEYIYLDPNNTPSDPNDDYWVTVLAVSSQWVYDDVNSPCIDAGMPDPNDYDWHAELWPHGGRINMGAYGGTPQASMSPNPIGNMADLDHDDKVDVSDVILLSEDWLYAEYLLDTDLNRNGQVDIADFAEFAEQWLWAEL